MIKLENLEKTYHTDAGDVHALSNVSLTIPKGSVYGIVGASGAGKSTLIRSINLLEKPDAGKVFIDGENITLLSGKSLEQKRQKIGMIFQHFNLLKSKTVYENIAFPLKYRKEKPKEIEKRVDALLKLVDLEDKKGSYPSQLSGGQKQRVAIARALANDPNILLCDEATSALDPQTTASILTLLRNLNEKLGITVVLITHQMSVVKEICDRVAVVEAGQIVEEAQTYELFANPQKEITKRFVDTVFHNDDVERLLEQDDLQKRLSRGEEIWHLVFRGEGANHAYIAELIRKFYLDISVIYGSIEIIQNKPIGNLYVSIGGNDGCLRGALGYLRREGISTEPLLLKETEEAIG
ncbi:MAG: ATP-binding cassette domain-containing protein [Lachnospiraceae bacterium]|nr:ATP-binding cassette domain-containing protein [Lachnospiraceae bacterium]